MDNYDFDSLQSRREELVKANASLRARHKKPTGPIVMMGICFGVALILFMVFIPLSMETSEPPIAMPIIGGVLAFVGLLMLIWLLSVVNNNKPINEEVRKNNIEIREIDGKIMAYKQAEAKNNPNPKPTASVSNNSNQKSAIQQPQLSETGDQLVFKGIRGAQKTLDVYEDRIVLTQIKNMRSFMTQDLLKGSKEIYYADMTSIQVKKASSLILGYIQFEVPGIQSTNNFQSENSWTYDVAIQEKADEIASYVKKRISDIKKGKVGGQTTVVQNQVSAADELAKFKKLLDEGVITQEEFDAKKKQLLGL